ncbi:hypothetical protein TeGR_g3255 [Tetraparma gracilis]|uniref:Uncharacterized protein n=1 Tax=Tetraparma gracilis TaxID=2962635 RepID=A0ABQ6MCC7_9STRA|nr:hypothetical protein TeGR_g3255 [Tetraparma gracilis]
MEALSSTPPHHFLPIPFPPPSPSRPRSPFPSPPSRFRKSANPNDPVEQERSEQIDFMARHAHRLLR